MIDWKSMFFRLVELARSEKTVNDEAEIIGWATHEDGQHYPIHAAQGGGGSSSGKNNSFGKEGKNKSASKENSEKKNKILHSGKSDAYDKSVSNALDKSVNLGKADGNEHLMFLQHDGTNPFGEISGKSDFVIISQDMREHLEKAQDNSISCIHNHPRSSSFSDADIATAAQFKSISDMRVKGHDGTEYYFSIGNGKRPSSTEIKLVYKDAVNSLMPKYEPKVLSGEISEHDAWKEHSHEAAELVSQKYGWVYERRLPDEQ